MLPVIFINRLVKDKVRPVGFSTLPRQSGIKKYDKLFSEMRSFDWKLILVATES